MTQKELAVQVNLARTSITNIEKGRQKLLVDTIWDISNALGVELSQLFPGQQEKYLFELKELPPKHKRIIKKIEQGEE